MRLMTVTEAAKALNVSRQRVRALITKGKLRAEKVGTVWLLRKADVEQRNHALHKTEVQP